MHKSLDRNQGSNGYWRVTNAQNSFMFIYVQKRNQNKFNQLINGSGTLMQSGYESAEEAITYFADLYNNTNHDNIRLANVIVKKVLTHQSAYNVISHQLWK